jgi:CubicO group peptidase (beta-lactamase class C family)
MRDKRLRSSAFSILLLVLPISVQKKDISQYGHAIVNSRKVVQAMLSDDKIPASVQVAKNGAVVWAEGFGFADLEQQVPVTNEMSARSMK